MTCIYICVYLYTLFFKLVTIIYYIMYHRPVAPSHNNFVDLCAPVVDSTVKEVKSTTRNQVRGTKYGLQQTTV